MKIKLKIRDLSTGFLIEKSKAFFKRNILPKPNLSLKLVATLVAAGLSVLVSLSLAYIDIARIENHINQTINSNRRVVKTLLEIISNDSASSVIDKINAINAHNIVNLLMMTQANNVHPILGFELKENSTQTLGSSMSFGKESFTYFDSTSTKDGSGLILGSATTSYRQIINTLKDERGFYVLNPESISKNGSDKLFEISTTIYDETFIVSSVSPVLPATIFFLTALLLHVLFTLRALNQAKRVLHSKWIRASVFNNKVLSTHETTVSHLKATSREIHRQLESVYNLSQELKPPYKGGIFKLQSALSGIINYKTTSTSMRKVINVTPIINTCASLMAIELKEKNITINKRDFEQNLTPEANPDTIFTIIYSILHHVISTSPKDTLIEVSANSDDSHFILAFKDNGFGFVEQTIDSDSENFLTQGLIPWDALLATCQKEFYTMNVKPHPLGGTIITLIMPQKTLRPTLTIVDSGK